MHTVGVAAVTLNPSGQVLLIRTQKAGWELPGGKVEPGEDLLAAVVREAREESGCAIDVGRLVGIYLLVDLSTLMFVFRATSSTASPDPGTDDDALDAGWFEPREALQLVTHAGEHQRLEDGLADRSGVTYRAYYGKDDHCCTFW